MISEYVKLLSFEMFGSYMQSSALILHGGRGSVREMSAFPCLSGKRR